MIRSFLFVSVILVFLFAACGHSGNDTFIISENDRLSKIYLSDSTLVIVPPKVKYAAYTFIIDSTGNFYFYPMPEEKPSLGVYDDDEPEYIGLQPNRVFSIPKGSEYEFFEKNVLNQKSSRNSKTIMVASYKDTINSGFLKYLLELSKVKDNKIWATVRLALPEEHAVIKSKINGLYYEPKF